MRSLPVYHLISKKADVEDCTWLSKDGSDLFRWWGTLVYDGEVYDHIRYRMRGGVWRYSMGKNMFKFDFNRGHYFQARDDYGNKYATKWNRLNFSACIQQGSFGQRGSRACSRPSRSGCSTWPAAPPQRRTTCSSGSSTSRTRTASATPPMCR